MSMVSLHRGDRDGLARGLGLRGIPTRNLVEFEGGGSMLCREVLGEMLAASEHGDGKLHARGVAKMRSSKKSRGKKGGPSSTTRWAEEGCDGGAAEEGRRVRLLCQADALAWLRESSSQANPRWSVSDQTMMLMQRGGSGGHNNQQRLRNSGHNDQRQLVTPGWSTKDDRVVIVDNDDRSARAAAISTGREEPRRSPSPCSPPTKRRRQPPVKFYDHVHNPRVLRALVDDTVTTGIAGAGALMAEEDRRIENLRLQLRLACRRATELQDQMFQSQTGAPHRELLGELQLDRTRTRSVGAQQQPDGSQGITRTNDFAFAAEEGVEVSIDIFDRYSRSRRGGRSQQNLAMPSTSEDRAPAEATTFSTSEGFSSARRSTVPACRPRKAQQRVVGSCRDQAPNESDSSALRQSGTRLPIGLESKRTQWGKNMSEVVTTCNPPLSPLLTPTTSLRRYLSSLRPFSADSAQAAWGLAEPPGGNLHRPSDPRRCQDGDTLESGRREPRWPVLFVMGSAKPSVRHPLDVHSLPLVDDDMVALLAGASGEPVEKVLAMTQVLLRFDYRLLQAAVKRLCCASTAGEAGLARPSARGGGWISGRSGELASATQARMSREAGPKAGAAAALGDRIAEGQELCGEPVFISEATAERILTSGFLCGVFGDGAVRDIVSTSRPVVVFDSAEAAGVAASTVEKTSGAMGRTSCSDRHADSTGGSYLRQQQQPNDGESRGSRSGDVSGQKPVTATTAHGNSPPSPLLRLLEGPKREESLDEGHPLGAMNSNTSVSISPAESLSRRAESTPGRQPSDGGEGVLVMQLVRATAARFRVHSLAVRHRDGGHLASSSSSSSTSFSQSRGALDLDVGRDLFCRGFRRTGLGEDEGRRRRPASAGSDELGLPPLKLVKWAKSQRGPRSAWAPCGRGGGERVKHYPDSGGEEEGEEDVNVSGVHSSRSTPRCLRPGFKVPRVLGYERLV